MTALLVLPGGAVAAGALAIVAAASWAPSGASTASIARLCRLDRLRGDLVVLDETVDGLVAKKLGYLLLGSTFPVVMYIAMSAVGLTLPVPIPAGGALALAAVLFFVPDIDVRRRASAQRGDARLHLAMLCELIALERLADAGTSEALVRAVSIPDTAFFRVARDEITRAQLAGQPAGEGLRAVASRIGMPEIADVADILALSGSQGAAISTTLRARAESARGALRSELAAAANAASERMVMPVAVLGIAFLALLGYPAIARIIA